MNTRTIRGALATAALLAACASTISPEHETRDPARLAAVRSVVVLPLGEYPELLAGREAELAEFERALAAGLARRGFEVSGQGVFDQVRTGLAAERGLDLRPGHAAPVDLRRLDQDAYNEVAARGQADALLFPSVVARPASLSGVHAVWDGRSQSVEFRYPGDRAWEYPLGYRGKLTGLSLRVSLRDLEGRELYRSHGGLHVLERLDRHMARVPVAPEELLEPERVERAVELALGGLDEDRMAVRPHERNGMAR